MPDRREGASGYSARRRGASYHADREAPLPRQGGRPPGRTWIQLRSTALWRAIGRLGSGLRAVVGDANRELERGMVGSRAGADVDNVGGYPVILEAITYAAHYPLDDVDVVLAAVNGAHDRWGCTGDADCSGQLDRNR